MSKRIFELVNSLVGNFAAILGLFAGYGLGWVIWLRKPKEDDEGESNDQNGRE